MLAISIRDYKRGILLALGFLFFLLVIFLSAYLVVRVRTGTGLGLRSLPRHVWHLTQAVLNKNKSSQLSIGEYDNIIFLHHSTGDRLIEQGKVRELLTDAGFSFWDQSYNHLGLRDPEGLYTGYSYSVPRDNTDPDGLARVFQQPVYTIPVNALSGLLQHEVIILKSCFVPTSKITSFEQLQQYKDYYLAIRDTVDQHPEKLFILVTQPPLNPAETNSEEAERAKLLSDWLTSEDFLGDRKNLYTFNLFDYLTENDPSSDDFRMLAEIYRNGSDSHPNQTANREIGPIFANHIKDVIELHRGY